MPNNIELDNALEDAEFEDLSKKELDPRLGYVFKLEVMPKKGAIDSFRIK